MKTVRLRGWTENDVNIALEQLSRKIQSLDIRPEHLDLVLEEDFARRIADILDKINTLTTDVSNRVLKGIRINNIALIESDIQITSDMIPFELNGVVYDETITDRLNQVLGPVNIRGNVATIGDLPLTGNLPRDGMVVLRDETNDNNQWLYIWSDSGTPGIFNWIAVTPFGVDLTNFYTKDETWSTQEIIADQLRQDNVIRAFIAENNTVILNAAAVNTASQITANNITLNNQINDARRVSMQHTDTREAALRNDLVPNTRRVNGLPLNGDITVSTLDIPHGNHSLYRVLLGLQAITNIVGIVDNFNDLPTPVNQGEAWLVRNGTVPGTPDLYVIVANQFVKVGSFTINLDNYYTIPEIDQLLHNQEQALTGFIDELRGRLESEINRSIQRDDQFEIDLEAEASRAQLREAQLSADIISAAQNTLTAANNHTDSSLQSILGLLNTKVGQDFPTPLVTGLQVNPNDSNSQRITLLRTFLNQNNAPDLNILLPGVSAALPGLMSPAQLQRFNQMSDWINSFTIGGLFVGSFPTRAALNAAPIDPGWNENDWATVQADETQIDQFGNPQMTKYILSLTAGWQFSNVQGGNMPGLASNTRAGLVQGNPTGAGNISVTPDDGRMSVNGWADLIVRILNSESVVGLNSQGQPTPLPTGMRLDIQNLQNNKVDRIDRTAENNLVTVNVNSQGQVIGGASTQTSNTISDFNTEVDSRANTILATALGVGGSITTAINNIVNNAISAIPPPPSVTVGRATLQSSNANTSTLIITGTPQIVFSTHLLFANGVAANHTLNIPNQYRGTAVFFGSVVAGGSSSVAVLCLDLNPGNNNLSNPVTYVNSRIMVQLWRDL